MKCANCGFEKHIDDSFYCQECGASLENFCTNDMCDYNTNDDEPFQVPSTAKFCPICGEVTTFKKLGYFDK